jgi:hypothetical protein
MKVIVNGTDVPARDIGSTGWADLVALVTALGAPLQVVDGRLMVQLRPLLDAGLPSAYDSATGTLTIGQAQPPPLPALPTEPVGAGVEPWHPVSAPICSGPVGRSASLYERVIKQFQVVRNPRHAPRGGATYCNIFLWDVTRAMGAEVPHWVQSNGKPSTVGVGHELDANATVLWLDNHGPDHGWRRTDAETAQARANEGKPTVAVWANPGGIGHVAVVRPYTGNLARGPAIAQAGETNFDDGWALQGFGLSRLSAVEYFIHD